MKKTNILFLVLLLTTGNAASQGFNFDIGFAMGTPQGSFQQSLDRNSYGIDGSITYQIPYTPIHFGIGGVYQNFGWSERSEYFSPDIQEVRVKVRTTNNMFTPHLIMRFEPDYGLIKPFVEGLVGFNYLYTESSVVDDWDEHELASTVNFDYYTPSYGIGGGLKFKLYEGYDDDGDYVGFSLVVKAKHMLGGEADYLKEGDLIRSRRGIDYNISRSRTDLTTFNLGFVFNF